MSYDFLRIEFGNPLSQQWANELFVTRTMFRSGGQLLICRQGLLWRKLKLQNRQVPFHGDLILESSKHNLVARMTNGAIEWVRYRHEQSNAARELLQLPNGYLLEQDTKLYDPKFGVSEQRRGDFVADTI